MSWPCLSYKRCREITGEQDLMIDARGSSNGEVWCKPLAITAISGGHKIRAKCEQNPAIYATPERFDPSIERWRLSPNGRRLEIR
jgi:hypothetical protein